MKKLSKEVYNQIRAWVYRYARHLDITRWQYFFENGSREAVVEALSFYQNEDGGFGKGFEPDCTNPHSQPMATDMAYEVLKSLGFDDKNHPMMQGIIKFVENSEYFTEHGWYWSIPSNNNYPCEPYYQFPHSPWWPDEWPAEAYMSGSMARFVRKYFEKETEIVRKTLRMLKYRLPLMQNYAEFCTFTYPPEQSIQAGEWTVVLDECKEWGIISGKEYERLADEFLKIVEGAAVEDVRKEIRDWRDKQEINDEDLDAIITKLSSGNVWNEDGLRCEKPDDKKEAVASVSGLWWPIMGIIGDLRKLKEHGRLDISSFEGYKHNLH